MTTLFIIIALLVINAFFVAAEFSLVKIKSMRISALVASNKFGAKLTKKIHANLEAYLAACQLGITMASLGLGWVGEPFVAALLEPLLRSFELSEKMIHSIAFISGFLIFSSLHITVGEQVPKTLAIRKSETVALWCALPLHVFYIAFYPLNILLNFISGAILRLMGVAEAPHNEIYSTDEIQEIVSLSTAVGEIKKNKGDMLNNLFNFDRLKVSRVMMPIQRVNFIDISLEPEKNIELIKHSGHSRFPLIDSSNESEFFGIILVRDLYNASLNGDNPWQDLKAYARKTLIVNENQNVAGLFDLMRQNRTHFTMVVDEYGSLVGIVTIEDLLEEIVGDIQDETDIENHAKQIKSTDINQWLAEGHISLVDLERAIGFKVNLEVDANTLTGYLVNREGRIPVAGTVIKDDGFHFEIIKSNDRFIDTISITLVALCDDSGGEGEV